MEIAADFKAAIPEPYQILGLRLLPFSLGRYRLLQRFKCAFVSDTEASASIEDLLWGVAICSMRCDDFIESLNSGNIFDEFKRWAKRIKAKPPWYLRGKYGRIISRTFIGKMWRKNHSFNFVHKTRLFQRYIEDAQKIEQYQLTNDTPKRSTAHWSTSVEIVLRGELGWTDEEIKEAPLSKALSDYFKHLEQQGLVTIFTEEDIETGKRNAEALAEMEALLRGERINGS